MQDTIDLSTLESYGNDITNPVQPGCTRIAFQNARGIERWPNPASDVIESTDRFDIGIFGIAEPNCAWNDDLKVAVNASIRKAFGNGFATCVSIPSKKIGYLPGGIMQLIRGPTAGRHQKSGTDKMGRFAWQILRGCNERKICVITAYRVCQTKGTKPSSHTSTTSYWLQVQQMIRNGVAQPDPRNQILKDIGKLIIQQRGEGCEIILMIDANDSTDDDNSEISKFQRDMSLHDIHATMEIDLPPTTRLGSTKRIDFMFATEGILEYVQKAGYCGLHEVLISDHNTLWADINLNNFFGGQGPSITPPKAREFSVDNIEIRNKFLDALHTIHEHQRLPQRIRQLEVDFSIMGATPTLVRRYNQIDLELIHSIKAAVKKTIKRRQHGYARSPAITLAGSEVLFWKSVLTSKRNDLPITTTAANLASRNNIPLETINDLDTNATNRQVQKAWSKLRQCQREAVELREKWLESVARIKASTGDPPTVAKTLKILIRSLHDKRMHSKLSRITKGAHTGVDFIEIPTAQWYYSAFDNELYHYTNGVFETHAADNKTPNLFVAPHTLKAIPDDAEEVTVKLHDTGDYSIRNKTGRSITWKKISDKSKIEQCLMERNKRHLQQMAMEDSPPSQTAFEDLLGDYGCNPTADDLLDGDLTDNINSFPRVVRTWLSHIRRTDQEKLKCNPIDGYISRDDFQQAFRSVREKTSSSPSGIHYTFWKSIALDETLSDYHTIMMRLPFMHGFVNDRWTKCIDVMLEKKKGIRQIHQMRIIGLVEADFNTALKLFFAKQMVANSEMTQLTEEQWGGRPGRTATEPALRKMLSFEYGRVMYVTMALFANDAVACFDRMVPNISSLIARKYGVVKNVMRSRNATMERMQHKIRTGHGESTGTYQQHTHDVPLAGETQGKGDVASLWSLLSQTILRTHQHLHQPLTLPHVTGSPKITKNNDAFVDDCDGMASQPRNDFRTSERETRLHLQTGAQLWAELIRLTGGNIAFHKCAWQMLAFEAWTFPPTIKERPTGQVRLHDATGHYSTIRKMGSNTPNKGLGCRQSVDGCMDKEYKHREEQCRNLASRAQLVHTTFRESHSLLMHYMIPSITYPMAGTTFSTRQCSDLNIILDRVMLNKLHVNRNMPRAVVYSPRQFAGMNYPSIQICQDQRGILTMLQHFRWNGTLGTDMLVVLSAIQLVSGLCEPVLEDVDSNLSYVPFGWFIHQRTRLREMNGKLWVEHQWTPPVQRQHDQSLMSAFLVIPGVTPIKLRHSNYCRLYMRVITVADLANIKGDSIPGDRMDGKWQSDSTLQWPRLPRPPAKFWRSFRWCFRRAFSQLRHPGRLSKPVQLDQPLGHWHNTPRHIQYPFYRNATHAFNRNGANFLQYDTPTTANLFFANGSTTDLPRDVHPIDARFDEDSLWTSHRYTLHNIQLPPSRPATKLATPHARPNMSGVDGSVDIIDGDRASAYCVHHNGTKYSGATRYPQSEYATSYRSELEAIHGATKIAIEQHITQTDMTCDNKEAVNKMGSPFWTPAQMLSPEADIILAQHHLTTNNTVDINLQWIKGHQDDDKTNVDLSDEAQINIEMDELSKHERIHGEVIHHDPHPGSGAMLSLGGQWVTTNYKDQIQSAIMRPKHIKFFLKKYRDKTIDDYWSIYWRGIGNARDQLSDHANIRIMKYLNGWLNTGRQKGLFGKSPECPGCGWHEETQLHIMQCNHPQSIQSRNEAFDTLTKYYHHHKIPAQVYVPFIKLCRRACTHNDMVHHDTVPPSVQLAIDSQTKLGCDFLLRGYLTRDWLVAIQIHNRDKPNIKLNHLYLGLWNILFQTTWEQRNNHLHGDNSMSGKYERQLLIRDLLEWKRQSYERLGYRQHYLTSYTPQEVQSWQLTTIRETVQMLTKAAQNYADDMDDQQQTRITDFFPTIPTDDDMDSYSSYS